MDGHVTIKETLAELRESAGPHGFCTVYRAWRAETVSHVHTADGIVIPLAWAVNVFPGDRANVHFLELMKAKEIALKGARPAA